MGAKEDYEARKRAAEAQEDKKKRWYKQREPIDRFTGWLVVWTALLFLAGIASAIILVITDHTFKKQLNVMQGTLDEMRAEQRPWISAKTDIDGQLIYSQMGLSVPFKFELKNSGHTPALHIFAQAMIFDLATLTAAQKIDHEPFSQIQTSLCEAARGVARMAGRGGLDYTIFPGEAETMGDHPVLDRQRVEQVRVQLRGSAPPFQPIFHVITCIDYRSPEGAAHRTSYLYWIMRQPTGGLAIDTGPIEKDAMRLLPLGSYAN